MGHVLTGPLPKTRKWVRVVGLIHNGAGAAQVANATTSAAERWFEKAAEDTGVVETVWLLMRLPLAARTDDFAAALRDCGLSVSNDPGLLELVGAVTDAIDRRMPNCRGRTDLGEMAQMAAAESLTEVIGGRLNGLFGTDPDEVQREFARLRTSKQFGFFAKDYFARFTSKVLDFFLSKTLPDHIGEGKRFRTLAQQAAFTDALDTHCRETGKILEAYAGDWLMKHNFEEGGDIARASAAAFTGYAMKKLTDELRLRATPDGP
jgi:hypothetical protein